MDMRSMWIDRVRPFTMSLLKHENELLTTVQAINDTGTARGDEP